MTLSCTVSYVSFLERLVKSVYPDKKISLLKMDSFLFLNLISIQQQGQIQHVKHTLLKWVWLTYSKLKVQFKRCCPSWLHVQPKDTSTLKYISSVGRFWGKFSFVISILLNFCRSWCFYMYRYVLKLAVNL